MKRIYRPQLFLIALLFIFVISNKAFAQLSGTYTVPGDYGTIQAAADALETNGVSGAVIINIATGSYTVDVDIDPIPGTSSTNTVTFQSATGVRTDVVITGASNRTVLFDDGVQYIILKDLTVENTFATASSTLERHAIQFQESSGNVTLENCIIKTEPVTAASIARAVIDCDPPTNAYLQEGIKINNCLVQNGSYGLWFDNINGAYATGIEITNTVFENQGSRGLQLVKTADLVLSGNTVRTSYAGGSATYVGVYLNNCDGTHQITNNYVYQSGSGMIQYGFRIEGSATSVGRSLFANNSVHAGGSTSTGNSYCMDITNSSDNYDIYNNTFYLSSNSANTSYCVSSFNFNSGSLNIKNNVFANFRGGGTDYSLHIANAGAVGAIENNIYWTSTGTNFRGRFGSITTIWATYLGNTGEANSQNIDPTMSFVPGVGWQATNLALMGEGEYFASADPDIDGNGRVDPTSIGAHELDLGNPLITTTGTLNQFIAFVGNPSAVQTYTVEGSSLTDDIVINAPAQFQIQEQGVGPWGSSVTLTETGGVVNTTTIEVRYNPGAAGSHSGDITHTSTGATQKDVAVSGVSSSCSGTFSGTYTISNAAAASCTNYQTWGDAVSDLIYGTRTDDPTLFNGPGIAGPVIFEARGIRSENIVIEEIPGASSTNTVTFRPETGQTATIYSSAAQTIDIDGADYLIFSGAAGGSGTARRLVIQNRSTTGNAVRFINQATNITMDQTRIQGDITNTNSGIVVFAGSTQSLGNNNITLSNCDIFPYSSKYSNAIYSNGESIGKPNRDITITECEIYDFFRPNATSCGIYTTNYTTDWVISGNDFYQTSTNTGTGTNTTYGIRIAAGTQGDNFQITGNHIGGSAINAGGSAWTQSGNVNNSFVGIFIDTDDGATVPQASNVLNNTIANINWNNSSSANGVTAYNNSPFVGIYAEDGLNNIGTTSGTGNTIGAATGTGSITVNTTNNSIHSYGIVMSSPPAGNSSINYNTIGSITTTASNTSNGSGFVGIIHAGVNGHTISHNTIGSTTTTNSIHASTASTTTFNTQEIVGIYLSSGSGSNTISNNTIANMHNNYAGTDDNGQIRGIVTFAGNGGNIISGNSIFNLSTASANPGVNSEAAVIGIAQIQTSAYHTITNNTIHSLSNSAGSANVQVNGIYFDGSAGSAGSHEITRNFIHSLSASTSGAGSINGININRSTGGTYANNMIRLGIDASGSSVSGAYTINGILVNSEDFNPRGQRIYFNTIYIGGNSGGASTTAAYNRETAISSTPPTEDIKNNIFHNARTGSGSHYAIILPGNNSTACDYNVLSAGANVGLYGGVAKTFSDWQNDSGLDGNSLEVTPEYQDATGSAANVDLHLDPSGAVNGASIDGAAVTGTGVTIDYDGDARDGSSPDIGADEFAGGLVQVTGVVINELLLDMVGTDNYEYVEIYGDPNTDYSGLTLLALENDAADRGIIDWVFPLNNANNSGVTDAGGFEWTGFLPTNSIENASGGNSVTILLVQNFTGALNDDLDTDDDGVLDITPWTYLIDGVTIKASGAHPAYYPSNILTSNFDGQLSFVPGASRIPDGANTGVVANDWKRNDFDGCDLPGLIGSPTPNEAGNTPGETNGQCNYWTGDVSTEWTTSGNWTKAVPTLMTSAYIPASVTLSRYPVNYLSKPEAGYLYIESGGQMTLGFGDDLDVDGDVIMEGTMIFSSTGGVSATVYINGDLEVSGSIVNNGENFVFDGTSQDISGTNVTLGGLELTNNTTLDIDNATSVTGIVGVRPGSILNTNGNLTLQNGAVLMHGAGTPGYTGSVNGPVTIRRTGASSPASYNYWSSPVQNADVNILGNSLYRYTPGEATGPSTQELRQAWESVSGINMDAGVGYISRNGQTVSFNGVPNNSENGSYIEVDVVKVLTKNGIDYNPWNLIGNPLPSPLDADAFIDDNSGVIGGAIYYWDDDASGGSNYATTDYATWNKVGPVVPSDGGKSPSDFIPVGQSFFVEKINNGVDPVVFRNEIRSTEPAVFFRKAPIDRLWISVINSTGAYNETLIGFLPDATEGRDYLYDAIKLRGSEVLALYTKLDTSDYAIQAFPILTTDRTVELGIEAGVMGEHTLRLSKLENLDETATIILEDRELNIFQNLRVNADYTFTATRKDLDGRFYLHFYAPIEITSLQAGCNGGDAQIQLDQPGSKQWNYRVINDHGYVIHSAADFSGVASITGLDAGSYIVKLIDAYGYEVSKEIEISAKEPVVAEFETSSSVLSEFEVLTIINQSLGADHYHWDFGDGTVLTGVENPTHTYISPGEYEILLRASNEDCIDENILPVSVQKVLEPTGIGFVPENELLIYSYDQTIYVKFDFPKVRNADITVYNVLGKKIHNVTVESSGLYEIKLTYHSDEFYFIRVVTDQTYTRKVLLHK